MKANRGSTRGGGKRAPTNLPAAAVLLMLSCHTLLQAQVCPNIECKSVPQYPSYRDIQGDGTVFTNGGSIPIDCWSLPDPCANPPPLNGACLHRLVVTTVSPPCYVATDATGHGIDASGECTIVYWYDEWDCDLGVWVQLTSPATATGWIYCTTGNCP